MQRESVSLDQDELGRMAAARGRVQRITSSSETILHADAVHGLDSRSSCSA
ncbi:hypothetical protein [Thiocapsa roseopersicina]|uniref:hypothetical protein n=1 Tax=Thiocapsa roseopersicina TaxID=1058 RepID=UPI0015878C8D|nr:hypothetical protein [Thiocapsa roseopersicina]